MKASSTQKLLLASSACIAGAALVFTGWKLRDITQARQAAAKAAQHVEKLRMQINPMEARQRQSAERANAVERDNALLATSIEKVRVAHAARTIASASLSPEAVERRFEAARHLATNGDADHALQELLWCYDVGFRHAAGTRPELQMRAVLPAIVSLGERHPPAVAALRERVEKVRERLLSGDGGSAAVSELSLLTTALKEPQLMLAIHDQLSPDSPHRASMASHAFAQLVESRRYSEALVGREFGFMSSTFEAKSQRRPLQKLAINSATRDIEVLAGAGEIEHARRLTERILKVDDSTDTRALLRKHLERAGHPELLDTLATPPSR
jgi:hypothetical protein